MATCAAASSPGSVRFCSAESAALGACCCGVALSCVSVCSVLMCGATWCFSFWTLQLHRRMEALDVGGGGGACPAQRSAIIDHIPVPHIPRRVEMLRKSGRITIEIADMDNHYYLIDPYDA